MLLLLVLGDEGNGQPLHDCWFCRCYWDFIRCSNNIELWAFFHVAMAPPSFSPPQSPPAKPVSFFTCFVPIRDRIWRMLLISGLRIKLQAWCCWYQDKTPTILIITSQSVCPSNAPEWSIHWTLISPEWPDGNNIIIVIFILGVGICEW